MTERSAARSLSVQSNNVGPGTAARTQSANGRRPRSKHLRLSVVVPTRNEQKNVAVLHDQLESALNEVEYEVIVVDDSDDGATRTALALIAANDPRWRVIERPPAEQSGLSTAAVAGIGAARGASVCIMDGDLQHPPDVIPALLAAVEKGADVAVASRYASGGSELGLAGRLRLWGSRIATTLTHLAFPETQRTTDPLSGYFCCRREAVSVLELRPVGFKVLVELLVCAPEQSVIDIAYAMQARVEGTSKADPRQAALFARHLLSLFVYVPGSARPLKFVIATIAGVAAVIVPLLVLVRMGTAPMAAWVVAVVIGTVAQFALHRLFTFREVFFHGAPAGVRRFHPSAVVSLVSALSALVLLLAPAQYAPLALAAFVQCLGMFAAIALIHPRLSVVEREGSAPAPEAKLDGLKKRLGADQAFWVSPSGDLAAALKGSTLVSAALLRGVAVRGRPILLAEAPSTRHQSRVNLERESALLIPVAASNGRPGPVAVLTRRARNPFSATELEEAVRWLGEPAGAAAYSSPRARITGTDYIAATRLAAAATSRWARAKLPTAWRFAAVGAAGLGVNQGLLWLLVDSAHIQYLLGAAVASQGSTAFNFAWLEAWVFRGRRSRGRVLRFIVFDLINSSSLAVRLPVMFVLTSGLHVHYLLSNIVALALTTVIRFLISDDLIWAPRTATTSKRHITSWAQVPGSIFRYDIDGLIAIESEAPLLELEFFALDGQDGNGDRPPADMVLQVGQVGGLSPRREATVRREGKTILYRQHLGSLIANFQIDLGPPVRVIASPGLALSPHVLYTNVVEPLLRFMLIKRARVLVHAACISLDGTGVLVSARTDTGKTSTILRVLSRTKNGEFLSDDMTIIDAHGVAGRYPKPLTISAHTLGAVRTNRLNLGQRAALALQSRVHSRQGRNIAHLLGTMNVPIMAINAGVQFAVPPPKYTIDELMDCDIAERVSPSYLFLIERGPKSVTEITPEVAVSELLKNSEDAYGFPPYAELAPLIELGDQGYSDLLRVEHAILTAALESVTCVRVRSDAFDWDQLISDYVVRTAVEPAEETA